MAVKPFLSEPAVYLVCKRGPWDQNRDLFYSIATETEGVFLKLCLFDFSLLFSSLPFSSRLSNLHSLTETEVFFCLNRILITTDTIYVMYSKVLSVW